MAICEERGQEMNTAQTCEVTSVNIDDVELATSRPLTLQGAT